MVNVGVYFHSDGAGAVPSPIHHTPKQTTLLESSDKTEQET